MWLERSEANDFVASFFLSGGTGGWCGGLGGEKCVLVISSYFRSLGLSVGTVVQHSASTDVVGRGGPTTMTVYPRAWGALGKHSERIASIASPLKRPTGYR